MVKAKDKFVKSMAGTCFGKASRILFHVLRFTLPVWYNLPWQAGP